MARKAATRRPFTLLEVLTVLAVISVLVTFLLPKLNKAKERAHFAKWLTYSKNLNSDFDVVAHWDFQEMRGGTVGNAAVAFGDEGHSPEKLDAVVQNSDAFWVQDVRERRFRSKGAMAFRGWNSHLIAGEPQALDFVPDEDEFTVVAWVKVNRFGWGVVVGNGSWGRPQWVLWITPFGGCSAMVGRFPARWWVGEDLRDGRWHCVAVVNQKRGLVLQNRLYVDGKPYGTGWERSGSAVSECDVLIGGIRLTENRTLGGVFGLSNGLVDEIAVFRRALNEGEIRDFYESGKP